MDYIQNIKDSVETSVTMKIFTPFTFQTPIY